MRKKSFVKCKRSSRERSQIKTYSEDEEEKATKEVYDLVAEVDTIYVSYFGHDKHGQSAKELRAKLDLIIGEEKRLSYY